MIKNVRDVRTVTTVRQHVSSVSNRRKAILSHVAAGLGTFALVSVGRRILRWARRVED